MKTESFEKIKRTMLKFFEKKFHKGEMSYYQFAHCRDSIDYFERTNDLYELMKGRI